MRRLIAAAAAAALGIALSACGAPAIPSGGQSGVPTGPLDASETPSRAVLMYVTDAADNSVYVIVLPGGKLVQKLTGFNAPTDVCVDKSGDVYVVDSLDRAIRAYRHGAKVPFRVLNDHPYFPVGCAVDPVTGDLAVANGSGATGNVAIFPHGQGPPSRYEGPRAYAYSYCTYDGAGRLYVDAKAPSSDFVMLELSKGAHKLRILRLRRYTDGNVPPPIHWDGEDLALANAFGPEIDAFRIDGDTGVLVRRTRLYHMGRAGDFWIQGTGNRRTLYAAGTLNSIPLVAKFAYPAGGRTIRRFYDVVNPSSVAVSVKSP